MKTLAILPSTADKRLEMRQRVARGTRLRLSGHRKHLPIMAALDAERPPQGPLCQVPAAQPDGRHRAVAQMTVPSDPELAESGEQVVVGERSMVDAS